MSSEILSSSCFSCQEIHVKGLISLCQSCYDSLIQELQEVKTENDRLRELNQSITSIIKTKS